MKCPKNSRESKGYDITTNEIGSGFGLPSIACERSHVGSEQLSSDLPTASSLLQLLHTLNSNTMSNNNILDCLSYNIPVHGVDKQICVTTNMDEKGMANTIISYSNCGINSSNESSLNLDCVGR